MKVKVKLFATLGKGRFEEDIRQYSPETTVGQVIDDLNIPVGDVKIVFVNNRHVAIDRELHEGDVLAIFPPIGGG